VSERKYLNPQPHNARMPITDQIRALISADRTNLSCLEIEYLAREEAAAIRRMVIEILTTRLVQPAPSLDDHARLYEILHRSRAGRAVLWQANMATTLSKLG
jgi:hypothetical protein